MSLVRNDADLTLSAILEAQNQSAIFWQSPTCSQICSLSTNDYQEASATVQSVEILSDDKVVNQEDFLLQIVDTLGCSMTMAPLGTSQEPETNDQTQPVTIQ